MSILLIVAAAAVAGLIAALAPSDWRAVAAVIVYVALEAVALHSHRWLPICLVLAYGVLLAVVGRATRRDEKKAA